jgi:hypothetical protein
MKAGVNVDISEGIATITFNRPKALNAITPEGALGQLVRHRGMLTIAIFLRLRCLCRCSEGGRQARRRRRHCLARCVRPISTRNSHWYPSQQWVGCSARKCPFTVAFMISHGKLSEEQTSVAILAARQARHTNYSWPESLEETRILHMRCVLLSSDLRPCVSLILVSCSSPRTARYWWRFWTDRSLVSCFV